MPRVANDNDGLSDTMIDEPSPLASVDEWREFLAGLNRPGRTPHVQKVINRAQRWIEKREAEQELGRRADLAPACGLICSEPALFAPVEEWRLWLRRLESDNCSCVAHQRSLIEARFQLAELRDIGGLFRRLR